jgi:hypothetical protein
MLQEIEAKHKLFILNNHFGDFWNIIAIFVPVCLFTYESGDSYAFCRLYISFPGNHFPAEAEFGISLYLGYHVGIHFLVKLRRAEQGANPPDT